MKVYYNEIDPYAAAWLRNLIDAGHIARGEVDTRSIVDVRPDDLRGFDQCHFFAGIGGWSYALRLAGWPDDRPVWTGSCPCQPFSLAGAQKGFADPRHLWPIWRELIRECAPPIVFGEQVASATDWLGLVRGDLEAMEYAVGAMPIQAASAGADHLRDRYWFVADAGFQRGKAGISGQVAGQEGHAGIADDGCREIGMADADQSGASEERKQRGGQFGGACGHQEPRIGDVGFSDRGGWAPGQQAAQTMGHGGSAIATGGDVGHAIGARTGRDGRNGRGAETASSGKGHSDGRRGDASEPPSAAFDWIIGADGKARRVKSGIRLLAHGVPARVGKLRGFGNAIDPRPAAEFIGAAMTSLLLSSHHSPRQTGE